MTAVQGLLVVISAPSGAGKTSLVKALLERQPNARVSVSHTTRAKRTNEVDGTDYHFVDERTFEAMREAGAFLEHAVVFGHHYGTAKATVANLRALGHDVVLEIDWQGAEQVRSAFPDAVSIFVLPPSRRTLIERLRKRGQDGEKVIAERTRQAVTEMSHYGEFDYVVVNDDFTTARAEIDAIVTAERLRTESQKNRHATLIVELLSPHEPIQ